MSMVFTRRPPTRTCRRFGALSDCAALNRLQLVKAILAAAPAASLKNSLRLGMSEPPRPHARRGPLHHIEFRADSTGEGSHDELAIARISTIKVSRCPAATPHRKAYFVEATFM